MNIKEPPRISVIIPTYNRAQMVVEAVESVLVQSHSNVEIIVVDDGSKDDTWPRLAQFQNKIVRIGQKNQGVAAARNTGLKQATGEFVAFLDSDDLWHQRKLEKQLAYMQAHPEVDLLACHVGPLRDGPQQCLRPLPDFAEVECTPITCTKSVLRACFATSTVMVRRKCLEAVGPFDTTLKVSEDREMWIRIAARFQVRKHEIELTFSRPNHTDHLSSKPGNERNAQQMIEKVFRDIPELRRHRTLKRRALSVAAYESSIICTEWGEHCAAIGKMMRSLLLWPIPNDSAKDQRLKSLVVMTLRLARLRRN